MVFSPRSKPFIILKPGVSGSGPEYPGNPECPAPNSGYSAPPEASEQIFEEFDFEWIWKVAYVITVSLSSINTLDYPQTSKRNNSPSVVPKDPNFSTQMQYKLFTNLLF
jgi:hypothetical protein